MTDASKEPLVWESYYSVSEISKEDLDATEEALGYRFPDDYRTLLLDHQGQSPSEQHRSEVMVSEFSRPRFVGAFTPVRSRTKSLVEWQQQLWKSGYPPSLLWIANSLGQPHFALDYHKGRELSPDVVYVNSEAAKSHEELVKWASGSSRFVRVYGEFGQAFDIDEVYFVVFHVADSITEFLEKLQKSD